MAASRRRTMSLRLAVKPRALIWPARPTHRRQPSGASRGRPAPPVYFDRRLLEAGDKQAIRQAVLARRCVDPDDPQRTELTLALAPVAIRVLARLDDGLLCRLVRAAARAVVTLGKLQDFLVSGVRRYTTFDSRHGVLPSARFLRQHTVEQTDVRRRTLTQAAKLSFPLRALLGQDVVLVRAAVLIAVRGAPETLRRAAIGFQFRHYKILRIDRLAVRAVARTAPGVVELLLLFLGSQHHGHLTSFEAGLCFHTAVLLQIALDPLHQLHPDLGMHHLAAAESK